MAETPAIEHLLAVGSTVRVGTRNAIVGQVWVTDPPAWTNGGWIANGASYEAALLDAPTVEHRLDDPGWGLTEVSTLRARVENTDGRFDALWSARGQAMTKWRYDRANASLVREFDGIVSRVALNPGGGSAVPTVELECLNQDLAAFDTKIPRRTITSALFGATGPDLGAVIPKVLGNVGTLPLLWAKDDAPGAAFECVVSEGSVNVPRLYRNYPSGTQFANQLEIISTGEYGVDTATYPGLTVVRFLRRQRMGTGGGLHTIYADVEGPAAERNMAQAVASILSDPTWGLGLTVDWDSIAAAAALIPTDLTVDGVLQEARPAREYLETLLMLWGGRLTYTLARGWSLTVESAPAGPLVTLSDRPGAGERTLLSAGRRTTPSAADAVQTLRVQYGLNPRTGRYRYEAAPRAVGTYGVERTIQHDFLARPLAGDIWACYWSRRLAQDADLVDDAEVIEEAGRTLREGDLVTVDVAGLQLASATRRIVAIRHGEASHTISHTARDPILTLYDALPLPAEQTVDQDVEPPAPLALTLAAPMTVDLSSEGIATATAVLRVTIAADTSVGSTIVDVRKNGTSDYGAAVTLYGSGTQTARFGGLTPGISYDFRARSFNGATASAEVTLLNQVAPGDTTPPNAPTNIIARQSGAARIVELEVVASVPPDWGAHIILRNTSNNPATATEIARGKTTKFTDRNVNYSTSYWYWARTGDLTFVSGNPGSITGATVHANLSAMSVGATTTVAQTTGGDIGSGQVGSGNIGGQQVGTSHRTNVSQTASSPVSVPASGTVNVVINHGLGRLPLGAYIVTSHDFVAAFMKGTNADDFTIVCLSLNGVAQFTFLTVVYW